MPTSAPSDRPAVAFDFAFDVAIDVALDVREFELDEVCAAVALLAVVTPAASKGALIGVNCARSVSPHAMGMAH